MKFRSKKLHKFPLLLCIVVGNNFDGADECSLNSGNTAFCSLG